MKWININQQLPEEELIVLAYCLPKFLYEDEINDFEINTAFREGDKWFLDSKDLDEVHLITHWMPLPEEPK